MKAIEYIEKASEIFVLSDSFTRIKELIDDQASTIDDIADVIILDPGLSAAILKLANSPFFNYSGKIDTVSKAVLILGITEIYNLVIAHSTKEAFKKIVATDEYLNEFWLQSIDCALLIKFLGSYWQQKNTERLFILGLLHNLGELVVNQFSPEEVISCVANNTNLMPWQQQSQAFGFTYKDCTIELLKQWQLPYNLIMPIGLQDQGDFSLNKEDGRILYIAKRIMLRNNLYEGTPINHFLSDEMIEKYGITDNLLKEAVIYCGMERLNMLALLKPSSAMVF